MHVSHPRGRPDGRCPHASHSPGPRRGPPDRRGPGTDAVADRGGGEPRRIASPGVAALGAFATGEIGDPVEQLVESPRCSFSRMSRTWGHEFFDTLITSYNLELYSDFS